MKKLYLILPTYLAMVSLAIAETEAEPVKMVPVYLRVVNLLPIKEPKVTLMRGVEMYTSGIKPGFLQNYKRLQEQGGLAFSVKQGEDTALGQFELKTGKEERPNYYTVVIFRSGERNSLQMFEDNPENPKEEKVFAKRLRVFVTGTDFAITVEAGTFGIWKTEGSFVTGTVDVGSGELNNISVKFTDKFGHVIDMFYPVDFTSHAANSVFVSQRGERRARIRVFPDNIVEAPTEEAAE